MVTQTTVQNINNVRFGSAVLEVGPTLGSLVNLGALKNLKFGEDFDPVKLEADNVGQFMVAIKNQTMVIEGDLMEYDLEKMSIIRGGIDTFSTVAASPVAVTNELHVVSSTNGVRLDHREGDGTEVSAITVTDLANTACVRNTDYVVYVDSSGYTCIARVSGSTVLTDGDTAKVSYSYTPNASVTLTSGGKFEISPRVVRLTNTNAAGKKFQLTLYKCTIEEGMSYKYPADNSSEAVAVHIKLVGTLDTTRTAGDQLFGLVDEQGPAA